MTQLPTTPGGRHILKLSTSLDIVNSHINIAFICQNMNVNNELFNYFIDGLTV